MSLPLVFPCLSGGDKKCSPMHVFRIEGLTRGADRGKGLHGKRVPSLDRMICFRSPSALKASALPSLAGHTSRCQPCHNTKLHMRHAGPDKKLIRSERHFELRLVAERSPIGWHTKIFVFRSSQIVVIAWLLLVAESVTEAVLLSGSLQQLYRKAMALELDFFQAAVQEGRQPKVGLLVLDFDETLSVSDTTSVIIDTAIQSAGSQDDGEIFISPARCTIVTPCTLLALHNSYTHPFTHKKMKQLLRLRYFCGL